VRMGRLEHNEPSESVGARYVLQGSDGCANGFWHSLSRTVAGVCDPGPSRTASLTEASYKDPVLQNPLARPSAVLFRITCLTRCWYGE
jgi:hypothetical protein